LGLLPPLLTYQVIRPASSEDGGTTRRRGLGDSPVGLGFSMTVIAGCS